MPEKTEGRSVPALRLNERYEIIRANRFVNALFPLVMFLLIIVIFAPLTGGQFLSRNAIISILNQALIVGTVATGVAFIYTTGNLDISVGPIMAFAAIIGATVYNNTLSVPLMVASCIVVAVLLMLFNCTLSAIFNIKTITAAIVMTRIYGAINSKILGASTLRVDYTICRELDNGGFRYAAFFAFFIISFLVYHKTKIGRADRIIGGNRSNAVQTGLSPNRFLYASFLMAGIGVGLAAVFTITRSGTINQDTGTGMGTDVMLATVLGGMSIFGGAKSNSYSGIIGALTVTALNKGLLMVGVSTTVIQGIRGVIFILLVFLNSNSGREKILPSRQQF